MTTAAAKSRSRPRMAMRSSAPGPPPIRTTFPVMPVARSRGGSYASSRHALTSAGAEALGGSRHAAPVGVEVGGVHVAADEAFSDGFSARAPRAGAGFGSAGAHTREG